MGDASGEKQFAYLFEAKGVQRFIFNTQRLRDLIAGSEMVAGLCSSDANDKIANFVPAKSENQFSRRAGASFCYHSNSIDELRDLRAKWRLFIMRDYPGLEFSDAIGEGDNEIAARENAYKNAGGIRNNYVGEVLPLGRPICDYAPLSGLPVTKYVSYKKDGGETVALDVISEKIRKLADNANELGQRVASRFLSDANSFALPRDFEKDEGESKDKIIFPLLANDNRIAVIHADLSGLGQIFQNLREKDKETIKKHADKIEALITIATKSACETLRGRGEVFANKEVLPARPLVLGGDDITIIIRADLAREFTIKLLEEFEALFGEIGKDSNFTDLGKVSACAGIAIVNKGMPFINSSHLAETLCKHAKEFVKSKQKNHDAYASAFSFYVQTKTAYEGASEVFEKDVYNGKQFTNNPYIVGRGKEKFPEKSADKLIKTTKAIAKEDGMFGLLREAKALMTISEANAKSVIKNAFRDGSKSALKSMFIEKEETKFPPEVWDALAIIDFEHLRKSKDGDKKDE